MIPVGLHIQDPAMRMTLAVMLKSAGYPLDDPASKVIIADTPAAAIRAASAAPTLVLASATTIPEAIEAMRQGVYGYIFVPLQPGEAVLMVERAAQYAGITSAPLSTCENRDLASVEWQHINAVLRACNGNQVKAARVLGIGRNTLWRKIKQYENVPPDRI